MITSNNLKPIFISIICATVLASSANAAWSGGNCSGDDCNITSKVTSKVSATSGDNLNLTISENGSVNVADAINIQNNVKVNKIENNGTITSTNGNAIRIVQGGTTNIDTIINNKDINAKQIAYIGIWSPNDSSKININSFINNGTFTASANAITIENKGNNSDISINSIKNNTNAKVSAVNNVFNATVGKVKIQDFYNDGELKSSKGAVASFQDDTTITKFTNDTNGVISGSKNSAAITFGDAKARKTTSIEEFTNNGSIKDSKFGVTLWGASASNSKISNFTNNGSISTTNDSLYISNASIDNFVNSENATISSNTIGVSIVGEGNTDINVKKFTNKGKISTQNDNAINIQASNNYTGNFTIGDIVNDGEIDGARGAYIGLWHSKGKLNINSIVNNGSINAKKSEGLSIQGKGEEVSISKIENNGKIQAENTGIKLFDKIKVSELVNNADINSNKGAAVSLSSNSYVTTFINNKNISSTNYQGLNVSGSKVDKIINYANILGGGGDGGTPPWGKNGMVFNTSSIGSIDNYGTISGAYGMVFLATSIDSIRNYGTMEATKTSGSGSVINFTPWTHTPSYYEAKEVINYGKIISANNGISFEPNTRIGKIDNNGLIEVKNNAITDYNDSAFISVEIKEINLNSGSTIKAGNNGINFTGNRDISLGSINVKENANLLAEEGNGINFGKIDDNRVKSLEELNIQGLVQGNVGIYNAGNIGGENSTTAINIDGGSVVSTASDNANAIVNAGNIKNDISLSNNATLVGNFINTANSSIEGNINIDNSKLDGSLVFSDSAKIQGDISLNNNSSISKDLITSANSSINGRIDINNSSLDNIISAGSSTINGKINVTNNSKINNINFENDAILRGDISVNEGSKLTSISTNNNSSIDGDIKISSNAKLDKIINKSTNKNAINGSIINKQNNALEIVNDNNSSINGGIVNEGSSVISITNKGHIGKNDDGFNVSNNKNGSIVIKDWQVNADSSGKLESINIGGNTNKVYVDKITVNQSGMDITKLDNLSQVINGVDISKIGSIQTAGSDLELTINPITNKLQAKPEVVKTIASAQVQSLVETTSKRTTFANSLMSNIMQDYTMPTNINTQRISLKDLENLRFASAGNIVSDVSYDYLMRYVGADSAFLNQMKLDYISNKKRNSIFILPYHSYQYVDLGAQGVSKGHTTGVIAGYSRASTYGIFGVYAGYEDVRMSTGYYEVNNIAYYAGLKYYNDIYSLSDNSSLYVKTHAKFAYLNNSLVKYIAANTAKANPTSYTYGLSADLGINYEYKKHSFSPEIGLDYEGSYTKAYSMVGKAALKVEDYLSSSLNLFSIKTAATWYAQWLPTLKTTISLGAKARLNDNIKTSVNFGEGVVSKNYSINKYSAFTSASLILPTIDSFTLSLNYNGNFAKKEQTHTAYLQASFNW